MIVVTGKKLDLTLNGIFEIFLAAFLGDLRSFSLLALMGDKEYGDDISSRAFRGELNCILNLKL